jgi:hypothetical protein
MATSRPVASPESRHYVWWFPGAPVKVHLDLGVVRRLEDCLSHVAPDESREGLLFGQTRAGVTEILDFQPRTSLDIPGQIASLPVGAQQSVVGYYRTQASEVFELTAKDRSLAEECFPKPHHVFLMVHANAYGPPTATFYFHERDHRIADFAFLEFPLDATLLVNEQHRRIQRPQPEGAEPPLDVPSFAAAERVDSKSKSGLIIKSLAALCVTALAIVFVTQPSYDSFLRLGANLWQPVADLLKGSPLPGAAVRTPSHPTLALHAIRRNGDLEFSWDRDSPVIENATAGEILIRDGDSQRLVSLDVAQLRGGTLLYSPASEQVLIQLTVTTPHASIVQSITAVLPLPPGSHAAPGSSGTAETYEPPVAMVRPSPAITPEQRAQLGSQNSVQVTVRIDKAGNVIAAHALPQKGVSDSLLNLAADVVRTWRFQPARHNHEPVPSDLIIQFVFPH